MSFSTSGERGLSATVIACCNAAGNYRLCSNHDDLQKKEQKPALTDHAPSRTLNEITESGWINKVYEIHNFCNTSLT